MKRSDIATLISDKIHFKGLVLGWLDNTWNSEN